MFLGFNDMTSIEEAVDMEPLDEGLKDILYGKEPSQKGKYHKYKVGSIKLNNNGKI